MLDDGYRLTALLSPIAKSGEELLRDLAHRVRSFRDMFQIWEDLNVAAMNDYIPHQSSFISRLRATETTSQTAAQAIREYDRFRHIIHRFAKRLFPWTMLSYPDHMSLHMSFYGGGRGIVFTAGNNQAQQLLTIIPSLRQIGCDLPIEVMYLGNDDLEEEMRDRLESFEGVVTRDLRLMIDDDGWRLAGWAAKPFAILMSSFREAIFIDADSFFFVDPTTLFETEEYRATGALFFKDRNLQPEDKRAWLEAVLPLPISAKVKQNRMWTGESGHMQESGVLVVDKYRHFIPVLLATRLNGPDRDGNLETGTKGVYDMMYGDKESFWLSWEMAGDLDYAFYGGVTGTMGKLTAMNASISDGEDAQTSASNPMICSPQLLHFDNTGKPLWFNGWVSTTKDDLQDWQQFDVYLREMEEIGRKPTSKEAWQIHEANVVCLEGVQVLRFTEQEKSTLEAILDRAKATSAMLATS
ncbi:hypothetical protein Q7P37_007764 [Cladosporium fusiforme]